jgi:hypothetical protein
MTKVVVFGTPMILATNPWAAVGMSKKGYYLRNYPSWINNPSPRQREHWARFSAVARQSVARFPRDGKFSTLQKRVKWIGTQLRMGGIRAEVE